MTPKERQEMDALRLRVAALERLVRDIRERIGMPAADLDEYDLQEALVHMQRRGDPSLIKAHLRRVNGRGV